MTSTSITSEKNYRAEAIRRLADGFAGDFSEFCAGDERVHELFQELASEFVEREIPVVDEDAATDVAFELLMRVTCRQVKSSIVVHRDA